MTDRKPDIPDISKIKCEDCRYSVDNVNEERPKMRFCAISGHALDIMDKGLPIWGCPIKDAYMQKKGRKRMDDLISRQAAIDALWKSLYEYEDKTEKQFQESEDLDVGDWILHRIFVQNMSDIDRQTILNLPSAQPDVPDTNVGDIISRQAAIDAIMGEPTDAHYPSWYAERLEQLPSVTEYTQKEKETAEQASENKTFYVTEFLTRICNQINEYHKNGKTEQIETLKWVVEQVQEIYGIYIKSKYDAPMTEKEIAYCENDVLIMQEILK